MMMGMEGGMEGPVTDGPLCPPSLPRASSSSSQTQTEAEAADVRHVIVPPVYLPQTGPARL